MNMTPEQKRIAIAEFEGWSDISKYTQAKDGWYGYEPNNGPHSKLPPYLTSRDAICGAVERLDEIKFDNFVFYLQKVTRSIPLGSNALRKILLATPAQITDALLLTLGHQI